MEMHVFIQNDGKFKWKKKASFIAFCVICKATEHPFYPEAENRGLNALLPAE